jgi:Na+-transporting methylmalonyl-CoA/oxaloacetate decarboxylase gamma subunit
MSDNVGRLLESFGVMGLGMLGIFVVMLILYIATFAVSKIRKGE